MAKKFLSLILALCLTFGLISLVGCGKSSDDNSNGGVDMGIISKEKVNYINNDGSSVYRIVRPQGDTSTGSAASFIFKQMKDGLGVNVKNVSDEEDGTDVYEILIGDTNRPESTQAMDYFYAKDMGRYNDFIICTIGKKIVINGVSNDALNNAADYFVKNYIKKDGIECGIEYLYATEGDFGSITVNGTSIGKFRLIWDTTTRSWLIQEEVRKAQEYIKSTTGYQLNLKEDIKTAEAEYEISIGNTVRAMKPENDYSYEDWEIKISGKKIGILGGSTYAVQVAVTEFTKMLEKGTLTDADSKVGTYSETILGYDSGTYYTLKWGDEFDGDSLDLTKWNHPTDSREDGNMQNDDSTVYVQDGKIVMLGGKRDDGTYYHCSGIQTKGTMSFNFGYLEMRAKIPDGKGVYSSFWTTGGGLEIDIFESLGLAKTQRANIHYWYADGGHTSLDSGLYGVGEGQVNGNDRQYVVKQGLLSDQFRTIGLYWTPEEITFIYDGEVYYTQPSDEYHFDKYQRILAGFNLGWPGRTAPDESLEFPLEYHIDYIRLFQIDGQGLKFS